MAVHPKFYMVNVDRAAGRQSKVAPVRLGASEGEAFYCRQYMPRLPSWKSLIQDVCPLILAPHDFPLVAIAQFGLLPTRPRLVSLARFVYRL